MSHTWSDARLVLLLTVLLGCSQAPARVPMSEFEPVTVADRAVELLDKDGSGILDVEELEGSPGLSASPATFDNNNDNQIAREELAAILRAWREEKVGLVPLHCEVTWKGKPLQGAIVQLSPEPFFDGAIPIALGQTGPNGVAEMSCSKDHLPESLHSLRAVKPGIYRVEVTHPDIDLPSRYNSKTRLGWVVSLRTPDSMKLDL